MQLALLLLLLLFGGKTENLQQLKPLLQSFGGEELGKAFEEVENLSSVVEAAKEVFGSSGAFGTGVAGSGAVGSETPSPNGDGKTSETEAFADNAPDMGATGKTKVNFALSPIAEVVDDDIANSLSRYVAFGK